MPTQLKRPRLRKPRLALSVLERYKVLREAGSLSTYMPVLLALSHAPAASVGQRARSRALALLLLSMLAGAQLLMSLPRQHQASTIYPRCPDDFGDDEFRDHFRFRKPDFYRLLVGFELANIHGPQLARYMHIGARVVRTDWALMVLLKRMASTATYKDLRFVVGGSKTAVCSTFLHMLEYLYNNFTDRVTSLLVWEDHMLGFATLMQAKGSPYDGLVGLLDGHFLDISRPGGAGCRGNNVFDWQVFNGKERSHGLKWQGIVLANGMAVLQGPWFGVEHDASCYTMSGVEEDMSAMSARLHLPVPLCLYADSAYAETMHLVRAVHHATASQASRDLNKHMRKIRVLVENLFAYLDQVCTYLDARKSLRLGGSPLGMTRTPTCVEGAFHSEAVAARTHVRIWSDQMKCACHRSARSRCCSTVQLPYIAVWERDEQSGARRPGDAARCPDSRRLLVLVIPYIGATMRAVRRCYNASNTIAECNKHRSSSCPLCLARGEGVSHSCFIASLLPGICLCA